MWDADPETGITRGVQVSTFDVTAPTAPTRIDVDVTPDSHSEVEHEPHALTVTTEREAIVPVEVWGGDGATGRLGALVYRIAGDGGLDRIGMLSTGSDWQLRPRRSLDLDSVLLTVGDRGVVTWDAATYAVLDTVRFEAPSFDDGGRQQPLEDAPGDGELGFDGAG